MVHVHNKQVHFLLSQLIISNDHALPQSTRWYGNDLREPREQAQRLPNDSLNDLFFQTPHLRDVNPIRC